MNTETEKPNDYINLNSSGEIKATSSKKKITHSYKTLWEKQKKVTRFWQFVAAGLAGIVVLLIILL